MLRFLVFIVATGAFSGHSSALNVQLVKPDSGFFLDTPASSRELALLAPDNPSSSPLSSPGSSNNAASHPLERVLSIDRFSVAYPNLPTTVEAAYGPFSTRQTIPAQRVLLNSADFQGRPPPAPNFTHDYLGQVPSYQQATLDLTAHVVTKQVHKDNPELRVLFYLGHGTSADGISPANHESYRVCIDVEVELESKDAPKATGGRLGPLRTTCSPDLAPGKNDKTCLATLIVPPTWWASDSDPVSAVKPVKAQAEVRFSVYQVMTSGTCQSRGAGDGPTAQIQSMTTLGKVGLSDRLPASQFQHQPTMSDASDNEWLPVFQEVTQDNVLRLRLPSRPLYPGLPAYIPVLVSTQPNRPLKQFTVRTRSRSNLKIIGAFPSNPLLWNVTIDQIHPKGATGSVTATLRDDVTQAQLTKMATDERMQEVFCWLVMATESDGDLVEGGRLVWNTRYFWHSSNAVNVNSSTTNTDDENDEETPTSSLENKEEAGEHRRFTTQLSLQKDDIQSVIPVARSWELLNTAVLSGKQVSMPLKVFIVSQAGKMADVTLQSSCSTQDESVLKVSSSCTSVYLDGSEVHGSRNATVTVEYSTYRGYGHFTVWEPVLPLDVRAVDPKLSVVKGWKTHSRLIRGKDGKFDVFHMDSTANQVKPPCQLRFQQTQVKVFARFQAVDQNSGRESFYISRQASLDITELVANNLRIVDSSIASLEGTNVVGQKTGRTEVQVVSPLTGRLLGVQEIRVGKDRVSLERMSVGIVAGLEMDIRPDPYLHNGHIARTITQEKLTAKYQEGLLDVTLHFSDGTTTPLRDIHPGDYRLSVKSLAPDVVEYAPSVNSIHPRVIAVGEGEGELLNIFLDPPETCQKKKRTSLASTYAYVRVEFDPATKRRFPQADPRPPTSRVNSNGEIVQNDSGLKDFMRDNVWRRRENKDFYHYGPGGDDSVGFPADFGPNWINFNDIMSTMPTRLHTIENVPAERYPPKSTDNYRYNNFTPLEIGMYALLAVFCAAMILFAVACSVYASRFKRAEEARRKVTELSPPPSNTHQPSSGIHQQPDLPHAHDWVWLGRSTFDRTSSKPDSEPTGTGPRRMFDDGSMLRPTTGATVHFPSAEFRITSNPGYHIHGKWPSAEAAPLTETNPNPLNYSSLQAYPHHGSLLRVQTNPLENSALNPAHGLTPPRGDLRSPNALLMPFAHQHQLVQNSLMEGQVEGAAALYSRPWRKNYAKRVPVLPPIGHGGSEDSADEKPPIPPHRVMDAATNTTMPRNEPDYPPSRLRGNRAVKVLPTNMDPRNLAAMRRGHPLYQGISGIRGRANQDQRSAEPKETKPLLEDAQPRSNSKTHSNEKNKKRAPHLAEPEDLDDEEAITPADGAATAENGESYAKTYKKPDPPKDDDLHRPVIMHFAQANKAVSSPDRQSTLGFNSLAMTMNNNQLANYIDSLKESMA